jgi:hypothetical protein
VRPVVGGLSPEKGHSYAMSDDGMDLGGMIDESESREVERLIEELDRVTAENARLTANRDAWSERATKLLDERNAILALCVKHYYEPGRPIWWDLVGITGCRHPAEAVRVAAGLPRSDKPPDDPAEADFALEIATYEEMREHLIASGKRDHYAVFKDCEYAGCYASFADALKTGYAKFGLQPFYVRQVGSDEGEV